MHRTTSEFLSFFRSVVKWMSFSCSQFPLFDTGRRPPVQNLEAASQPTPEPKDIDALCKLLLSDFKMKDEQDYIIDEIVAAFDKQNFTNKGFLSKVSDQQQKYLVRNIVVPTGHLIQHAWTKIPIVPAPISQALFRPPKVFIPSFCFRKVWKRKKSCLVQ